MSTSLVAEIQKKLHVGLGLSEDDKITYGSKAKPRPSLKMLTVISKGNDSIVVHSFHPSIYDDIPWLTGCDETNKFYCWPCLLFAKDLDMWNYLGVPDVSNLKENKSEHEGTSSHNQAVMNLYRVRNEILRGKTLLKSKVDNQNIQIKRRLIDVCCVVIAQQISNKCFNTHDFCNAEKCMKVMQFLRDYDSFNKASTDKAIDFIKTSPGVVTRAVDVLTKVLKQEISKEMKSSNYVSIILNQHSDNRSNPAISTVLRYVKNTKVYERFVGFTILTKSLSSDVVYQHILKVIEEHGIAGKIRGLSLDGEMLPVKSFDLFVEKMKKCLPQCLISPWYSSDFESTLQQCLSSISTCKQFSKTMASMEAYFHRISDLFLGLIYEFNLELILVNRNTNFSEYTGRRFASSEFISTVKTLRKSLIKLFDSIIRNFHEWDADTLTKAFGFRKFLKTLQTVFLLEAYSKIFAIFQTLKRIEDLQSSDPIASEIISSLNNLHSLGFTELWTDIKEELRENNFEKIFSNDESTSFYHLLFQSMVQLAIADFKFRYESIDAMKFLCSFNYDTTGFIGYRSAKWWSSNIKSVHLPNNEFEGIQIQNELSVAEQYNPSLIQSVHDLYQFIINKKLHHTFKALIYVTELILAMPFKPPSADTGISKLQVIQKWSEYAENSYGDISLFHIESDIFEERKESLSFQWDTLNLFQLT